MVLAGSPLPAASVRRPRRLKPDYADALCDLGCTYCAQVTLSAGCGPMPQGVVG